MIILFYFLLAVVPPLAIVYYVYSQDLYEKEPRKLLFISFLLGCLTTIFAYIIESEVTLKIFTNTFLVAFIGVALVEEGVKFVALKKYSFNKPDFNEPYDGIVYSVCISLGFATIENIGYVFGEKGHELGTGILRIFSAIPMHAACGVIMGYYIGLSKFNILKRNKFAFTGLGYAILIHGFYDYFLIDGKNIIFSFICLLIAVYFSNKAIKEHQKNSPFNNIFNTNLVSSNKSKKELPIVLKISEDDSLIALIKKYKFANSHNKTLLLIDLEKLKNKEEKFYDVLQLIYNNKI